MMIASNPLVGYRQQVARYINAKDKNRVHLMAGVFCEDACLQMRVNTQSISFPAQTIGLAEISKVLVTDFSTSYENVYTFCITQSCVVQGNQLECDWFVVMSDKKSSQLRIGSGKYYWTFNDTNFKVTKLVIEIEQMQVFEQQEAFSVLSMVETLDEGWLCARKMNEQLAVLEPFKKTIDSLACMNG